MINEVAISPLVFIIRLVVVIMIKKHKLKLKESSEVSLKIENPVSK